MSDCTKLIERLRVAVDVFEAKGCVLEISAETCTEIADALEKLVKERDAAVAAAENIHSDFVDYACSGRNNIAPYCGNRCADCTDVFGLCKPQSRFCNGFISEEYTEWRGAEA